MGERTWQEVASMPDAQLQAIYSGAPMGIFSMDLDGHIATWNEGAEQIFGWTAEEVIGRINPSAPEEQYHALLQRVLQGDSLDGVMAERWTKDGRKIFVRYWGSGLRNVHGEPTGAVAMVLDVTDTMLTQTALEQSEARFQNLLRDFPDAVLIHRDGIILYANQTTRDMFAGDTGATLVGDTIWSYISENEDVLRMRKREIARMQKYGTDTAQVTEYKVKRFDKSYAFVEVVSIRVMMDEPCIVSVIRDVTAKREAQTHLEFLAYHDGLTGTPNRRFLMETLHRLVKQAGQNDTQLAVVLLDLDNVKYVNDTFGHDFCDEALKQAANRLRASLHHPQFLGRIGGDEFVLLLPNVASEADAVEQANHVMAALRSPLVVDGQSVYLTPSAGLSMFPSHHKDAEGLISFADTAMYAAKENGGNQLEVFHRDLLQRQHAQAELLADMRRALAEDEFYLVYQPQLNLDSGLLMGLEALIRWHHPTKGHLTPFHFIDVAERSGFITSIGHWVLEHVVMQVAKWIAEGKPRIKVSVNVSVKQFLAGDFVSEVASLLEQYQVPSDWISIEITESSIMQNAEQMIGTLHQLRRLGIETSIDDFGTGYSSLSYLHRFRVGALKIDRSFIEPLTEDAHSQAIVSSIIQLAHTLGLRVCAEGVETVQQRDTLIQLGCDYVQGYLYHRPLPLQDVVDLLTSLNR